jgi:hypothetical protein
MKNIIPLLALSTLMFFSCEKTDPRYDFTITVINEEGIPLPNVIVEASADVPNALPDFKARTDDNGQVQFEYQYEAVLKIRATRGSSPPSWMGCNFVKLEADKNVQINVVLLPFDPSQPGC